MEHLSPTQKKTMVRIVEAAIELMSEKGFHRVSVQEIGHKAGLCEKTVFRYFPSKTELLTGIIRYRAYAKELKEEFTRSCRWDLGHDLRLAARLYLQATKAKRNAFRAYLSALESVDTNGDDYLKSAREILDFLHEYMLEMQKLGRVRDGDAELMARTFINTLHGYMLMYCLNDDRKVWQTKVASLRLTIDLFIQGFERKEVEEGQATV